MRKRPGYIAGRRLTPEQRQSEWLALEKFWKGVSNGRADYYRKLADGTYDEMRKHDSDVHKDRKGD